MDVHRTGRRPDVEMHVDIDIELTPQLEDAMILAGFVGVVARRRKDVDNTRRHARPWSPPWPTAPRVGDAYFSSNNFCLRLCNILDIINIITTYESARLGD